MIDKREIDILRDALDVLSEGFGHLPEFTPGFDSGAVSDVLHQVASRMRDNYPYFHPRYAGQMLKPPHTVARLAYALSLWINPNNHALDGGRASSEMEKQCVREIGAIFGWAQPLGHLAGGGTMANLEALWVAGKLRPGKRVIASSQAHYTHNRICDVLGIPFTAIRDTAAGHLDLAHAAELLAEGDVGTIVATIGNTGFGDVDPLPAILELTDQYDVRVHADAAYGGYFGLSSRLHERDRLAYQKLAEVDSIVIDPHKHGLQPYGCGCVLFRDPADGRFYRHDSPYTYFSSAELHLGEISLECSRPGAAAVALWATHRLLPPVRGGEFAEGLDRCLEAARALHDKLSASTNFLPLMPPALDIVVYAVDAPDTKASSDLARRVFELAAEDDLHLAMVELPSKLVRHYAPEMAQTSDTMTCLRSVLMKPEHRDWLASITETLEKAANRSRAP
jgi:glutamate/tyrosine decarboxylase-like PLP-dependent enzyme